MDWVDLPFIEAVRFLRGLKPTPRDVYDDMSAEARSQAFTVARVAKLAALQGVLDQLQDATVSGLTLDEFLEQNEGLGLTEAHLETVYRTNLQTAFGRGRHDQLTDPALGRAIWGWRYKTVGDDRVRPEHEALDGLVFEKGAHDEVFPPWDFNCRCSSETITRREAERDALESDSLPGEVQDALAESDFSSPALGARYTPNLAGYDLGLVSQYLNDKGRVQ